MLDPPTPTDDNIKKIISLLSMLYKTKLGGCLMNVLLLYFQPNGGFKLDLNTQKKK